jgi:hypothetical protein
MGTASGTCMSHQDALQHAYKTDYHDFFKKSLQSSPWGVNVWCSDISILWNTSGDKEIGEWFHSGINP